MVHQYFHPKAWSGFSAVAWVRNPLEELWLFGESGLFSSTCALQPCWCCGGRDCQWCLQWFKTETPLGTERGSVGTRQLQFKWHVQPVVGWDWGTWPPVWHCPSWERLSPSLEPEGWDGGGHLCFCLEVEGRKTLTHCHTN